MLKPGLKARVVSPKTQGR